MGTHDSVNAGLAVVLELCFQPTASARRSSGQVCSDSLSSDRLAGSPRLRCIAYLPTRPHFFKQCSANVAVQYRAHPADAEQLAYWFRLNPQPPKAQIPSTLHLIFLGATPRFPHEGITSPHKGDKKAAPLWVGYYLGVMFNRPRGYLQGIMTDYCMARREAELLDLLGTSPSPLQPTHGMSF